MVSSSDSSVCRKALAKRRQRLLEMWPAIVGVGKTFLGRRDVNWYEAINKPLEAALLFCHTAEQRLRHLVSPAPLSCCRGQRQG